MPGVFAGAWRRLLAGLLVIVLLLAATAAGLWWWSGTQHSLDWALERFAVPQGVEVEAPRGALRDGAAADALTWESDGLRVRAEGVELAWDVQALLRRELHLTRLTARSLTVQDSRPPSETPPTAPAQLALPFVVRIDELRIDRLRYEGATEVEASGLAARYAWDGTHHRLDLRALAWAGGRYRGQASLEGRGDLTLDAGLQGELSTPVPGREAPLALQLQAQAQGPLAGFALRAQLQAAPGGAAAGAPAADLDARITPWQPPYLPQARAQLRGIDLAWLWPGAPATALSGRIVATPGESDRWSVDADLANAAPGPWDAGRLPLARLQAQGEWQPGSPALVRRFSAELGGGRAMGSGRWQPDGGWRIEGQVERVDPSRLHRQLAPLPLSGPLQAQARAGGIDFGFDLRAAAPSAPAGRADAAQAALAALALQRLQARGRWADGRLTLDTLELRSADAQLQGRLELTPGRQAAEGRLRLAAPGLTVQAEGRLAPATGAGSVQLDAPQLAAATAWLDRLAGLPGLPEVPALAGRARLEARWQGGWKDPALTARLTLAQLAPAGRAAATPAWTVPEATLALDGRLAGSRLNAQALLRQGPRELRVALAGSAGRSGTAWQARADTLRLAARGLPGASGDWLLQLQQPVALRWQDSRLAMDAGSAVLTAPVRRGPAQARLAWEPLRWSTGQLETAGRLEGLPLRWVELLAGGELPGAPLGGDLLLDGRWQVRTAGSDATVSASLARRSGDIELQAETAEGTPARVSAGVRDARLWLEGRGADLRLGLRWDSERAGVADGELRTRLTPGGAAGWQWEADAPLAGRVQAQLPRLRVWSLLAPPGWRIRGSLAADVAVSGTRAEPRLDGRVAADDLALRSVVDGVALEGGRLRGRIEGPQLVVEELLLRGAGAQGGTLSATGTAGMGPGGLRLQARARLDRLRASVRSDRLLTVSGEAGARLEGGATTLEGTLRVDRARITLPEQTAPRLGDDVRVRNLPPGVRLTAGNGTASRPLRLAVDIDLGEDFRVAGRGVDTALQGRVRVTGESLSTPRLAGTVRAVDGSYAAYGQRLAIERGELRFTGPADNPALDILALRPSLTQQKVGVQVSGRAQAPVVRLYADPEMSEAEKLSWLVLGRPSAAGGAEAALLQRAALAFLSNRGVGPGAGIAQRFGLDELSVSNQGEQGAAITLGKRFADNFYAAYERSVGGAVGTLFLFYELSRRLTLRAEAGDTTGVDLIYTFSFD